VVSQASDASTKQPAHAGLPTLDSVATPSLTVAIGRVCKSFVIVFEAGRGIGERFEGWERLNAPA
jgi:hypothetical protein